MKRLHSYETMAEAIRLVESGLTYKQAGDQVGAKNTAVRGWYVQYKAKSGEMPRAQTKRASVAGKAPKRGYVPELRAGMSYLEMLSPETLAECYRVKGAKTKDL